MPFEYTGEHLKEMIRLGQVTPYRPNGSPRFVQVYEKSEWRILTADWKLHPVKKGDVFIEIRRGVAAVEFWTETLAYLHCVKADMDFFLKKSDDDEWEGEDE